jgi:hypothetical protein
VIQLSERVSRVGCKNFIHLLNIIQTRIYCCSGVGRELCLGTITFGWEATEELCHQMLDRFVEADGNFIDTANIYSQGVSEEIVGRW